MDLFLAVIFILVVSSLGWLMLNLLGGGSFGLSQWHLFYPIGVGLLTYSLFMISWIGLPINLALISALSAAGLVTQVFLLSRRASGRTSRGEPLAKSYGVTDTWPALTLAIGGIAILFFAAAVLSVGKSYSSWDGMAIWSVKGYGIAREGTIFAGRDWGSHQLSYPLNLPLQISSFDLLTDDWLPHSKLIFPLYYLSLLVGLYSFLRRHTSQLQATLGSLLVATSPIVFDHATIGYANLPFSTYLVLGILSLIDGGLGRNRPLEATGSLMLGLAAWTRPEGIYLVSISAAALWVAFRISRTGNPSALRWVVPVLILALPWQAFTVLGGYQASATSSLRSTLSMWAHNEFRWFDAYWIARYFAWQATQHEYWGIAVPAIVLVLLASGRRIRVRGNPVGMLLTVVVTVALLTMGGYFYIISAGGDPDFLLSTSVERLLMPAMILGIVGSTILMPARARAEPG